MYTDLSQLRAQLRAPGMWAEIRSFVPGDGDFITCDRHHAISSWLTRKPKSAVSGLASKPRHLDPLGDVIFLPCRVPILSRHPRDTGEQRTVVLRVSPEKFAALTEFGCGPELWETLPSVNIHNAAQMRRDLLRLANEILFPGFASSIVIEGIGISLIGQLARHLWQAGQSRPLGKGGLAPWQMRRIRGRVESDPECKLPTVCELAGLTGVSVRHLERAYKRSTGQRIYEYITDVRIDRARELLSQRDLPLKEISARLGFSAPHSFSAAFRRVTGQTPRTYRNQVLS